MKVSAGNHIVRVDKNLASLDNGALNLDVPYIKEGEIAPMKEYRYTLRVERETDGKLNFAETKDKWVVRIPQGRVKITVTDRNDPDRKDAPAPFTVEGRYIELCYLLNGKTVTPSKLHETGQRTKLDDFRDERSI